MSDLFSDPILLVPVIAILVIFGVGYVTAMIWSYNRDAKKQGKKSGCLPMVLLALLICSLSLNTTGCGSKQKNPRMSKNDVLSTATNAIQQQYPETFESYFPYRVELQDGIWRVYGQLPDGMIGGTPEAEIRDVDGEVIRIYHTQ